MTDDGEKVKSGKTIKYRNEITNTKVEAATQVRNDVVVKDSRIIHSKMCILNRLVADRLSKLESTLVEFLP